MFFEPEGVEHSEDETDSGRGVEQWHHAQKQQTLSPQTKPFVRSMMLVVQPSLCLFDRANVLFLVAPKQAPPPPPYFAIALAAPRPPHPPRPPPPPFNCSQTLERSACQIDAFSALSDTPSISLLPQHIFGEFGTGGPLQVLAGQRPFIRTDGRLPICRTDPPCPLGGGAPHPPSSRPKWTSLAHEGGPLLHDNAPSGQRTCGRTGIRSPYPSEITRWHLPFNLGTLRCVAPSEREFMSCR